MQPFVTIYSSSNFLIEKYSKVSKQGNMYFCQKQKKKLQMNKVSFID